MLCFPPSPNISIRFRGILLFVLASAVGGVSAQSLTLHVPGQVPVLEASTPDITLLSATHTANEAVGEMAFNLRQDILYLTRPQSRLVTTLPADAL